MNIKYRIRKRKSGKEEQYYVDYKRFNEGDNLDDIEWRGGFYAHNEEEARDMANLAAFNTFGADYRCRSFAAFNTFEAASLIEHDAADPTPARSDVVPA